MGAETGGGGTGRPSCGGEAGLMTGAGIEADPAAALDWAASRRSYKTLVTIEEIVTQSASLCDDIAPTQHCIARLTPSPISSSVWSSLDSRSSNGSHHSLPQCP